MDGKPVEIGRVNYVLRAIRMPAGSHDVVFTFDPASVHTTEGLSIASIVIIYVLCGGALCWWGWDMYRRRKSVPGEKR